MNEVYGTRIFDDVIPHTDDIFDILLESRRTYKITIMHVSPKYQCPFYYLLGKMRPFPWLVFK